MINISKPQEELLLKYVPKYKELNDLGDLLTALHIAMVDNFIGDDDEPTGEELYTVQRLYDQILAQNT